MINQARVFTTESGKQIVAPYLKGMQVHIGLPDPVVSEVIVPIPEEGYEKLLELAATGSIDITNATKVDTLSA